MSRTPKYASKEEQAKEKYKRFNERHPEYWKKKYLQNKEHHIRKTREWQLSHPEKRKEIQERYRQKKYGISDEDLNRLTQKQNGVCVICNQQQIRGKKLDIDHDHKTGRVRGLLCRKCNTALGSFKDSPEVLRSAIAYLSSYEIPEDFSI